MQIDEFDIDIQLNTSIIRLLVSYKKSLKYSKDIFFVVKNV